MNPFRTKDENSFETNNLPLPEDFTEPPTNLLNELSLEENGNNSSQSEVEDPVVRNTSRALKKQLQFLEENPGILFLFYLIFYLVLD